MSDIRSLALSRAYELVEAGKPEEARTVLEPILINDRDNADAWWIYAHAVTDPAEARHALGNVLRINPNYPGASELMHTLEDQFPVTIEEPEPAAETAAPFPDTEPDFVGGEPFWGDEEASTPDATQVKPRRSILPIAIVGAIVVLLVVILILLLPGLTGSVTPTPTVAQVAGGATETTVPLILPTEEITEQALTQELTPVQPEVTEATLSLLATISGEPPTPVVESTTAEVTPEATEAIATPSPTRQSVRPTSASTSEVVEVSPEALAATEEPTDEVPTLVAQAASATAEVAEPTFEAVPTLEPTATEAVAETAELPTKPAQTESPVALTEESDLTPVIAPTEPASTAEATTQASDDYAAQIAEELQAFSVEARVLEEIETSLGTTLVARVCTVEGPNLRSTLREVMGVMVDQVQILPANLAAIGVRLINCDGNRTLRIIVVDRESASNYAAGAISQTEFEAEWQPE